MAFSSLGLARQGSQNAEIPTIHHYTTTDGLATVIAADYFLSAYTNLSVGDLIFLRTDTGGDDVSSLVKVLTSSSAGVTVELVDGNTQWVYARQTAADLGTAGVVGYCVFPFDGYIRRWKTVLTTVVDADNALNLDIGGTNVTGSITLTASGAAAGDVDSATCTANNTGAEGTVVKVETDGGGTAGVVGIWIEFVRA